MKTHPDVRARYLAAANWTNCIFHVPLVSLIFCLSVVKYGRNLNASIRSSLRFSPLSSLSRSLLPILLIFSKKIKSDFHFPVGDNLWITQSLLG